MKRTAIGLSAAALAIAGTALAAHHETRMKPDSNGDGLVSREESQAHALAMFARFDANSDGQLDGTDRAQHHEVMRKQMFERLDSDGNGAISRDEFMAFAGPGKHRHGIAEPGSEGHDKSHHFGMRGHGGGMRMMRMADADNNGSVSQAEFTAAAAKRFALIDRNNDGQITSDERHVHRQEMRTKWHNDKDS